MGWDKEHGVWVKCQVTEEGKLIIDPSEIFENVPTDNEHGKAPDSDWAYDHEANPTIHQDAPGLIATHKADADAHHDDQLVLTKGYYAWNESDEGRTYPYGLALCFVRTQEGWPGYGTVITANGEPYAEDGGVMQIYVPFSPQLGGKWALIRFGRDVSDGWSDWQRLGQNLGDYAAKAVNTEYQAATDGVVVAYIYATDDPSRARIWGAQGAASGALSDVAYASMHYDSASDTQINSVSITFPVKKGNYWKVTLGTYEGSVSSSVKWVPLG